MRGEPDREVRVRQVVKVVVNTQGCEDRSEGTSMVIEEAVCVAHNFFFFV